MTQNERLLEDLRKLPGPGISAWDAAREFGIMRLAARIGELRSQGHDIETEMVTNGRVRYARYRLVK